MTRICDCYGAPLSVACPCGQRGPTDAGRKAHRALVVLGLAAGQRNWTTMDTEPAQLPAHFSKAWAERPRDFANDRSRGR